MTAVRGGWGEGTLTPLGSGKWKLRLPPFLGRGQVTFRAANKTEARREQRRILDEKYAATFTPELQRFTFAEWCDHALDRHVADPHSTAKLRQALKSPREAFGTVPLHDLTYDHVDRWRSEASKTLAASTLHGYTQAVKQMLNAAVNAGVIAESPARHVKNPTPAPGVITPFETLSQVEMIAAELAPAFRALPIFGCLTGLRPEELIALERADIRDGYVHVNKRFTRGMFKQGTKNGSPERRVYLDPLAQAWLDEQPKRIDTRLLWPGSTGNYLVLNDFRVKVWNPAIRAAALEPARRLKDMRHTYATWQLAGNCNTWTLSKQMGTSVKNIEDTYGRWIPGSEQVLLVSMSRFLGREAAQ